MDIQMTAERARRYFAGGSTRDVGARIFSLEKLQSVLHEHEDEVLAALHDDLGKAPAEGYMTELSVVYGEIREAVAHLRRWARPGKVMTPLAAFPAASRIYREPYGLVLILSPWNYPVNLSLTPLVNAVSAGNVCLLKCSRRSPHTAQVLTQIVTQAFPAEWVTVIPADVTHEEVLEPRYDFIFFTGGIRAGRAVYERAARDLVPVVLELGGKSPCIIDESANLRLAARRIAWGKWMNAGQTCVAVDYVVVHRSVKERFVALLREEIERRYAHAEDRGDYPRIVNRTHYERLRALLDSETGIIGGACNERRLRIAPAIAPEADWDHPVMAEELFGPILPVLAYENLETLLERLGSMPRPLACYIFTALRRTARRIIGTLSFGGGCVNDVLMHLSSTRLPFGGVGASGMGAYHGRAGFETFSHRKSVVHASARFDVPLRYAPFDQAKLRFLKKLYH